MAHWTPMKLLELPQNAQIGQLNAYQIHGGFRVQPAPTRVEDNSLYELLEPIDDATHTRNRKRSPPDSACARGTRLNAARNVGAWACSKISHTNEPHVRWVYGYIGTGKFAISQEVCDASERQGRPLASFFFFRGAGDRGRIWRLAPTLANQMGAAVPETAPLIRAAVTAHPGLKNHPMSSTSVPMQMQRLVYGPLKSAAERGPIGTLAKHPFLIVIDGLDECEDKDEVQDLIDGMLVFFNENPFIPLRVLITSRVEQHIYSRLHVPGVQLDNLAKHCSDDDITTFLNVLFDDARRRDPVIQAFIQERGEWPSPEDKRRLVKHIGGSFTFASTIFIFIMGLDPTSNHSMTPMGRLPIALGMNPGFDLLYAQTLARSEHLPHFLDVISTIGLLWKPLPTSGIAEFVGIHTYEVVNVLVNLRVIIHVPDSEDMPVTLSHTSLREFLTIQSRAGQLFAQPRHHVRLFLRCLEFQLQFFQHTLGEPVVRSQWRPAVSYAFQFSELHWVRGRDFFEQSEYDSALKLCRVLLFKTVTWSGPLLLIHAGERILGRIHAFFLFFLLFLLFYFSLFFLFSLPSLPSLPLRLFDRRCFGNIRPVKL